MKGFELKMKGFYLKMQDFDGKVWSQIARATDKNENV